MSEMLGPIHYWLYNKILKLEEIEMDLLSMKKPDEYMLSTKNLEEAIDETQIHKSLQDMIESTETRFANVIATISNRFLLENTFEKHGQLDAKSINTSDSSISIENIYKQLNNFLLDGMPCDTANNIRVSEENKLIWHTKDILHSPYWKKLDLNVDFYYTLRKYYISTFVNVFNENLAYSFTYDGDTLIHQILRR
ncbi:MAG: hypothetical protein KAH05_01455 [Clostridiales bacterium]|nr:hypothetical protein [Clostridiales bacterium]